MGRRALAGGGALAVALGLLLAALLGGAEDTSTISSSTTTSLTAISTPVEISDEEAAGITATLELIDSGKPLPYEQDGDTFQNREGLLPQQLQGHYREYTVQTPGSEDRGARRLVIGEAGETYYTRDHYQSFISIDPDDFR